MVICFSVQYDNPSAKSIYFPKADDWLEISLTIMPVAEKKTLTIKLKYDHDQKVSIALDENDKFVRPTARFRLVPFENNE
jgi:hypothetical protein